MPASDGPKPAAEAPEWKEEEEEIVVATSIFKNVTTLDLVGPYEVLHLLPNVKVLFVSHAKAAYAADMGMLSFVATATFDEVQSPHIIVVPGGITHDVLADAPLLNWLRTAYATSLYTTSVCSGSSAPPAFSKACKPPPTGACGTCCPTTTLSLSTLVLSRT